MVKYSKSPHFIIQDYLSIYQTLNMRLLEEDEDIVLKLLVEEMTNVKFIFFLGYNRTNNSNFEYICFNISERRYLY
jgi:hypothetical protein